MTVARLAAVLALFATPALAGPAPGALTAAEVNAQVVGHSVALEDGSFTWYYNKGGKYDADDGRVARSGTYQVRPDGRLCWNDNTGVSGCFQYYRQAGKLHARRADPGNSFELGAVKFGPLP